MACGLLDEPVYSSADALRLIGASVREFEARDRAAVGAWRAGCRWCRARSITAAFATPTTASPHGLDVIDLRAVCDRPQDYANPIEPSSVGGAKIARAIARVVTGAGTPVARLFGA